MTKGNRWGYRDIDREIRRRVEEMGFVKRRAVFELNLGSGFCGFVGFNRDRIRNGNVGINPVFGIGSDGVYERICYLWEQTHKRTNVYVVFSPLGYLTPERRYCEWHVTLGVDNQLVLDEMFEAIREYGLPFYEEYRSIEAMIEAIEHKTFWQPQWAPYTYPVMLVMKDRPDEAVDYVKQEQQRRLGMGGEYESDYDRFAGNILMELNAV